MRPTGRLHIGHFFGALANWIEMQSTYECFFFVADWHALTSDYADTSAIAQNSIEIATDWLASGLDPARCTMFLQSQVPEHAELQLLLSMVTPLGWLERVPTYKEAIENVKGKDLHTFGFLGYPVLQAADIVIYDADVVPVGEDQVAHVELTREIIRRFNVFYGLEFLPDFYEAKYKPLMRALSGLREPGLLYRPASDPQVKIKPLTKALSGLKEPGLLYRPASDPQVKSKPLTKALSGLKEPGLLYRASSDLLVRELDPEDQVSLISQVRRRAAEVGLDNFLKSWGEAARYFRITKILREPDAMLTKTPRIPGTDGRKMSKSYNNFISLSEDDDSIRKKMRAMVTDPARKRREDVGNPDVCPVYDWHKLFSTPEVIQRISRDCRTAAIGCVDCKQVVADALIKWIEPVRERRRAFEAKPAAVLEILDEGSKKARTVAKSTMERVREAVFGWKKTRESIASNASKVGS
jgi:tryptophanyl-tRNA synthetase